MTQTEVTQVEKQSERPAAARESEEEQDENIEVDMYNPKWPKNKDPPTIKDGGLLKWGAKEFDKQLAKEKPPSELKKYRKEVTDMARHREPLPIYKKQNMVAKVASHGSQEVMLILNFIARNETIKKKKKLLLHMRDTLLRSIALDYIARCEKRNELEKTYGALKKDFKALDETTAGPLVKAVLPKTDENKLKNAVETIGDLRDALGFNRGGGGRNRKNYGSKDRKSKSKPWNRNKGRSQGSNYEYDEREDRYRDRDESDGGYGSFEEDSRGSGGKGRKWKKNRYKKKGGKAKQSKGGQRSAE